MMPRYRVGLIRRVREVTSVVIYASTPAKAKARAKALAREGEVEWHFMEAPDPPDVAWVTPEGTQT